MNRLQMETVNRLHQRYGIARVVTWDFQPGIVFIEYTVGYFAEVMPSGEVFRRLSFPDESLGLIYDLTREALSASW